MGICQEYLPATEQQGHLPPACAEIEPYAVAAADLTFNTPWGGLREEGEALCAPWKLVEWVFR